jgi:hypothetical protein
VNIKQLVSEDSTGWFMWFHESSQTVFSDDVITIHLNLLKEPKLTYYRVVCIGSRKTYIYVIKQKVSINFFDILLNWLAKQEQNNLDPVQKYPLYDYLRNYIRNECDILNAHMRFIGPSNCVHWCTGTAHSALLEVHQPAILFYGTNSGNVSAWGSSSCFWKEVWELHQFLRCIYRCCQVYFWRNAPVGIEKCSNLECIHRLW